MKTSLIAAAVLLVLLGGIGHGCASMPGFVPRFEDSLGLQTWTDTLAAARAAGTLRTSGAQYEMVQRIGARVAAAAERMHPDAADYAWEFQLIDEPVANAWALPGGKSAVYTGLLPVTRDEQSLAMVMGHEVAHVLLRHGAARIANNVLVELGLSLADLATEERSPEERELVRQALGAFGTAGVMLPFSRSHELAADELGLRIAADAGYDPRAAVTLWERMAALPGERAPEILSTHPSEGTRIERLQEAMPAALALYEEARSAGR